MATKKTHEQFIKELQNYNAVNDNQIHIKDGQKYINTNTKLWFRCSNGHDFSTTPKNLITRNTGCPFCARKKVGQKNLNSDFVEKLIQRNKKFDTVLLAEGSNYKGIHTKIKFKCLYDNHSAWFATPASILQGHGCPQCGKDKSIATHKHDHTHFEQILSQRNNTATNKAYLVEGQQYQGQNKKLQFACVNNHTWYTTPSNILHCLSGCPFCATSKTFSNIAIEWLTQIEEHTGLYIIHRGHGVSEYVIPGTKYTVDGYCEQTNTVYEFHGNYWHGNPALYDHTQLNQINKICFRQLYANTIRKEQTIRERGYNLIVLWEDQYYRNQRTNLIIQDFVAKTSHIKQHLVLIPIHQSYSREKYSTQLQTCLNNNVKATFIFEDEWTNNQQLVLSKLEHYCNNSNRPIIHARKCVIRQCSSKEKRDLLNINHIQGNDKSQINYGAYYNDKLIAVMTFCRPRVAVGAKKQESGVWELSRFCTDVNYRIPGIASKLLKHFQNNNTWKSIYSFADRRWSTGNMYTQLGFMQTAINPPDYFYVIDGMRKHRWNYRKDVLKTKLENYDPSLTEYQNMVNHGYHRVWGAGTLKFEMKNSEIP